MVRIYMDFAIIMLQTLRCDQLILFFVIFAFLGWASGRICCSASSSFRCSVFWRGHHMHNRDSLRLSISWLESCGRLDVWTCGRVVALNIIHVYRRRFGGCLCASGLSSCRTPPPSCMVSLSSINRAMYWWIRLNGSGREYNAHCEYNAPQEYSLNYTF